MKKINEEAFKNNINYKLQKIKKGVSLALASVALFSALTVPAYAANPTDNPTTYATSYASVRVIAVEDRSINSGITFPQVLEKIYDDGKYEYFLSCPKSDLVVVKYSNGTEKNVVEALKAGDITIRTLQNYGITIYSQKKATITSIVDRSSGKYVPQVLELIYEDNKNEYYLYSKKSEYIIVKYSNGTEKKIVDALKDGDLTINTLQNVYGIKVYTQKKPTVRRVIDRSSGKSIPQAAELIYKDDKNEYYLPVQKSQYLIIRYSDGTEKNVVDALRAGDLTVRELERTYGITIITQTRTSKIESIVDKSKESGIYVPQVMEFIYCDGTNNYYFNTKKSSLVIVKYVDGTQKTIVNALRDGDLTIGDLQFTYNISVTAERVNAEYREYNPRNLYHAPDGTYWTSKAEYDAWVASQKEQGYQYQYKAN